MTDAGKLVVVKTIHTAIWIFFNVVIWYMLFAVVTNRINYLVWMGVGLIFLEGFILLLLKKSCPLTLVARRYSASTKDNFDIFLPNWLARYNKLIYTSIFVLILCMLIARTLSQ